MADKRSIVKKLVKRAANGVIGVTSDVLSAPSVIASKLDVAKTSGLIKGLRERRGYEGMPDYNADGSVTAGFKSRHSGLDEQIAGYLKKRKK